MTAKIIVSDVINTLPLFSGINEQEMLSLLNVARMRHLPRGQMLFLQGDPTLCFHIIHHGTIQMFRETPDGHEITPDILISGDSICPSEIMESTPIYKINARAVEDTELLEIPMDWLKENLQNFDHLMMKLFADVANRLEESTFEVERQAKMSATQLVTCFLYDICVRYDFDPNGFELPYSKTLIASRLGMELETLSRALPKLRKYGITVKGAHVTFDDIGTIKEFICEHCSATGGC